MKYLSIFIFWVFTLPLVQAGLVTQSDVTATTTSTKFLEINPIRNYLLIQNNGSTDVYIKMSSAHSGTEGIKLVAGGAWEPILPPRNSIYIKAASGTDAVTILESSK